MNCALVHNSTIFEVPVDLHGTIVGEMFQNLICGNKCMLPVQVYDEISWSRAMYAGPQLNKSLVSSVG